MSAPQCEQRPWWVAPDEPEADGVAFARGCLLGIGISLAALVVIGVALWWVLS